MNILAIETSSTACSVALYAQNKIIALHKIAPMQHAQMTLPLIDELLLANNIQIKQIDAIALGCGPGSFTGIRIATSIAQGIGYALNIPLIPISSLAALAQAAYDSLGWKKLYVAIDARIQEIYWALYQVNSEGLVELKDTENMSVPAALIPIKEWSCVGNAWQNYADQLSFQPSISDANCLPTAAAVLKLAIPLFKQQKWCSADAVLPVYLRNEVATKSKKR